MKPNLHYFNPTSDIAIAKNTRDYVPRGHLLQFERDLEYLQLILAGEGDMVILHEKPSEVYLENLKRIGITLPGIILIDEILKPGKASQFQKFEFSPWGWSPHIDEKFSHILNKGNQFRWKDEIRELASRKMALEVLRSCLGLNREFFIPQDRLPQVMDSILDIGKFLSKNESMVMKAPWSSSGRGIQILRFGEFQINHRQWIESVLKEQGYVMIEPYWDKILDFSFQFYSDENGINYLGNTFFETNKNGQFQKGFVTDAIPDFNLKNLDFSIEQKISESVKILSAALHQSKIKENYRGYFGVDAMFVFYKGEILIHPCVEINLRKTMGLISLSLREKLADPAAFWNIEKSNTVIKCDSPVSINNEFYVVPLSPFSDSASFTAKLYLSK